MAAAHPADHPGPLVYVADLDAPQLDPEAAHHLARVLRLRVGDPLTVGDGAGRWRPARFGPDAAVEVMGSLEQAARPEPALTVAFALVKGDKPELVVQKLTELGIDRIVPFRADRSVVRWDPARATKAIARLRAVAASAAMQCHRPHLPLVEDVVDLGQLVAAGAVLADRDGTPPSLDRPMVAVGPEGGWSDAERALDAPRVALGGHVLRAETAAITAGAVLTALREGLVAPAGR